VTTTGPTTGTTTEGGLDDIFGGAMIEHGQRLARMAFYLCGDRARAEDLVAEAFAATWPKWSAGRVVDLVPYLRRSVVNLAAKEHRHWLVVARHDRGVAPPPVAPGADKDLWARIDLARALRALPSPRRVVLVLRYLEDMTEADMATLLRVSPGTVKSRLARALDAMRGQLGGHHD
jgi:RNA polymerase sigma factor (sigma-70 family)